MATADNEALFQNLYKILRWLGDYLENVSEQVDDKALLIETQKAVRTIAAANRTLQTLYNNIQELQKTRGPIRPKLAKISLENQKAIQELERIWNLEEKE